VGGLKQTLAREKVSERDLCGQRILLRTVKVTTLLKFRRIADLYSTNSQAFVNIMMLEELGLVDSDSSPFWNGVVTLGAFVLFGFLPLIPYVIGAGF
jgi:hypothetical protein